MSAASFSQRDLSGLPPFFGITKQPRTKCALSTMSGFWIRPFQDAAALRTGELTHRAAVLMRAARGTGIGVEGINAFTASNLSLTGALTKQTADTMPAPDVTGPFEGVSGEGGSEVEAVHRYSLGWSTA